MDHSFALFGCHELGGKDTQNQKINENRVTDM